MSIKKDASPEELVFYGSKLRELREANSIKLNEMATKIHCTSPQITKLEKGYVKDIEKYAALYALTLGYLEGYSDIGKVESLYGSQKKDYDEKLAAFFEHYISIKTYVIIDTNAFEQNPKIVEEALSKYPKVIIPDIVISEIEYRKKFWDEQKKRTIWNAIGSIGVNPQVDSISCDKTIYGNHDDKIIASAKDAVNKYNCRIAIITNDKGFKAKEKINKDISIIRLKEFMQDRYAVNNMLGLLWLDKATTNFELPVNVDINAYLPNGKTLITSLIENERMTQDQKISKIKWLYEHGADIDRRENAGNYLPPISKAIQQPYKEGHRIFSLLLELGANPNAGSRNPYAINMVRQQNEGNMPLMVAAYSAKVDYVRELCAHPDIILDQQDSNGFTALTKCAFRINQLISEKGHVDGYKRYEECCKILIDNHANHRILDVDGKTASDYFEFVSKYLEKKGLI